MKIFRSSILASLVCFPGCFSAAESRPADRRFFAAPGAVYLDGVGPIYGGAAGAKNAFRGGVDYALFKTFGKAEAGGFAVDRVPLFGRRTTLSFGLVVLTRAEFLTAYGRGFDDGLTVRQSVNGRGSGLRIRREFIEDRLSAFVSATRSTVRFLDYKTPSGTVIPFSKISLHDVETNTLSVGAEGDLLGPGESGLSPLRLAGRWSAVQGRIAQSDVGIMEFRLKGEVPLSGPFTAAYVAGFSRANILSGVAAGGFDGKCGTVADEGLRHQCARLEAELTNFVTQGNRLGTTVPLGGSNALRSYRELRFKAANTGLWGVELRWKVPVELPAELAAFYELGHASDLLGTLYSSARYSAGLGARATVAKVPLRLEFAFGQDRQAAFFTLGRPW